MLFPVVGAEVGAGKFSKSVNKYIYYIKSSYRGLLRIEA
jgi:hypothetical protein